MLHKGFPYPHVSVEPIDQPHANLTAFLTRSSGPSDSKNVTSTCNSFGRIRCRTSGISANTHNMFDRTRLGKRWIYDALAPLGPVTLRPYHGHLDIT